MLQRANKKSITVSDIIVDLTKKLIDASNELKVRFALSPVATDSAAQHNLPSVSVAAPAKLDEAMPIPEWIPENVGQWIVEDVVVAMLACCAKYAQYAKPIKADLRARLGESHITSFALRYLRIRRSVRASKTPRRQNSPIKLMQQQCVNLSSNAANTKTVKGWIVSLNMH